MIESGTIGDLIPRREPGLPPGQREVRAFPRFSDKPLRWSPVPAPIGLVVSVGGSVRQTLSETDLASYQLVGQVSDFHCVTTWTYRDVQWEGVRLRDVAAATIGDELPRFAVARGADGRSAVFCTDDMLGDDVLLATHMDGDPMSRKHGAPLRLVSPRQYGYKSVKHLTEIDFCAAEPASTIGPKEHLRARVALEERHTSMPNWALRIPYRLSIVPTALAAERGLRRSPG